MNEKSQIYPILFMLAITIIFVGILATMFRLYEPKIKRNEEQSYQSQLLLLFANTLETKGIISKDNLLKQENLQENFSKFVHKLPLDLPERNAYEVKTDSEVLGYCYDILGNGLWGSMRALLALEPDKKTILGLVVYSQMETPGLGARIEEEGFRSQFSGRALYENGKLVDLVLIPEDQKPERDNEIRQITGATITSSSVLKMIKDEIVKFDMDTLTTHKDKEEKGL